MRLDNERGAALITALLVMASFTLLSAGIIFTVQSDTQISANYKHGQQAYYVANAGVQKSLSWFNSTYVPHLPASDYTPGVPMQYAGQNVTLSGKPGVAANYPDGGTSTSFYSELGDKTLQGNSKNSGVYQSSATLLRSKSVKFLDTSTFTVSLGAIERWRLDSIGFWGTSSNPIGRSEVSAVIEKQGSPFWGKALWANISATLTGPSYVDSYDADLGPYGGSNVANNGDIGSNGTISLSGSSTIFGTAMYMTSFTSWDAAPYSTSVKDGVSQLTTPKEFPPIPAFPVGTTDISGNGQTIGPGLYRKITISGGKSLTLTPGTYNIDELSISGGSNLVLQNTGNYTFYIKTKLTNSGGSIINPSQDPTNLQIFYSGTQQAAYSGASAFYGTVYAPNAQLTLSGASGFYGSFMASKITLSGGAMVHYDEGLLREFLTPRPFRIITWTQKNY